jgi:alpha-galactosidase
MMMLTVCYRVLSIIALALFALPSMAVAQKFDGLATTPPMGWNSWNHYACNINEKLIRGTADAVSANGMREAGYSYINIDDCWQGDRDKDGWIQSDRQRFPGGIKALADYVHSKGLKIGIYSDAGLKTCGGKPGSQGYEYQDALQYARWGIDYVKYDWCNTGVGAFQRNPREAYSTMRDAIHAAGRPMVLSICEWGDGKPWEWAKDVGHLWRTTGDIINCWDCVVHHGTWISSGILPILDKQTALRAASGPDHWNDPDMMEVGNLPTISENRAHFTMWAMLAAPLIVGTDIINLKPEIRDILTNKDVIAVNQDITGIQGIPWIKGTNVEIWAKPLTDKGWAIAVLNRADTAQDVNIDWNQFELKDDLAGRQGLFEQTRYAIRDLWTGKNAGDTSAPLSIKIGGRDAFIYRLKPL